MNLISLLKFKQMTEWIGTLLTHSSNQGSKANVVKPLFGILILLAIMSALAFYFRIPIAGYIILGLFAIIMLLYIGSYIYCLKNNPDLLRSENYNLEKTAIEKTAMIGDTNDIRIMPAAREYVTYNGTNQIQEQ